MDSRFRGNDGRSVPPAGEGEHDQLRARKPGVLVVAELPGEGGDNVRTFIHESGLLARVNPVGHLINPILDPSIRLEGTPRLVHGRWSTVGEPVSLRRRFRVATGMRTVDPDRETGMNDTAMDTKIIDGKAFAVALRAKVASRVTVLGERHGIVPGLAVVLAGEHPASQVYVRNKIRQTREAGMRSFAHRLPAAATQDDLLALVRRLNRNPEVSGILVQLPLPEQIVADAVIAAIDPAKDVDGFHPANAGLLAVGGEGMVPCTPLGCLMLLKDRLGDLAGARALVLGRSNIVGKPMAQLLVRESCTVTVAHSRTRALAAECRRADILVAAVGRPRMIPGDWIRPGATIIDVGINRVEAGNGKTMLAGDVDFESALPVAGAITPVPGGVGPMTIACLLHNTVLAACRRHGVEVPE